MQRLNIFQYTLRILQVQFNLHHTLAILKHLYATIIEIFISKGDFLQMH